MDGQSPGNGPARHGMTRRRFLRDTAVATGGAVAIGAAVRGPAAVGAQGAAAGATPAAAASSGGYTPVALTPEEFATLTAVVDRLIPAAADGPGAAEAGVSIYIDRSLASAYAASLALYQQNLAALNAAALAEGAGVFAALAPDDQDTLLTELEAFGQQQSAATATPAASNAPEVKVPPKLTGASVGFFALLLEHTREGMFGDPMYGGNANFTGWDLLGYPGIRLVWTAEEQAIGTVVPPAHTSDAKYGAEPAR